MPTPYDLIRYSALQQIQTDLATLEVVTEAGTARTLTAADNGKAIRFTAATAITVTLPGVATEDLADGFGCLLIVEGDGQLTVAKGNASDKFQSYLSAVNSAGKFAQISVVKLGDDGTLNTYQLSGDLV